MKQNNTIIKSTYKYFSRLIHQICAILCPASYAKYVYKVTTGKKLNLKNPQNFEEKNYWLRVYSDLSKWTELADKYKVREYVSECGLERILVKLYGVWDRAENIDFDILPDKFVLKVNHGFGKIIKVPDKSQLNLQQTKKQLNQWLRKRYGLISFEPHYWHIPRKIIAEEFLENNNSNSLSCSLIDYKFFCINGEPEIIKAMYDRNSASGYKTVTVDKNWKSMADLVPESSVKTDKLAVSKPVCLEEMLNISRILSKPFPFVRVDLYEVDNKVFFGELTFTPGGRKNFIPKYSAYLGSKMDLSLAKPRSKRFII